MRVTSLSHDSGAISASWKIQGPQAGNGSVGGPAEPLKKKRKKEKKPAPDYADPRAFMRFDTCQEIGHFHMLIHFTLTLTPGGWDISHVMNGRKKRTPRSAASHSWPGTLYL